MATQLIANNFTSGSITADKLTVGALNPVLTSVAICDASYNVLDDTAANTGGGYIQVTGTNFTTNSVVVINTTTSTSTTYVNNTTLRAQVPAFAAASYPVYVIDTYDGSTAIRYNGITFSNTPIWGTGTTLSNQVANTAFGINVSANSDSSITYSNTTVLPTGTTLASNGYFSGTVTIGVQTTYNFTVKANDAENQDASRTFSVTVTISGPNLWAWGRNDSGQLGLNDTAYRSSPTQIGTGSNWSSVATNNNQFNNAAIKTDGTLWTWGRNNFGHLGLSDIVTRSSPTQVGVLTNWSNVSMGLYNIIATKTDGTLWAWGYNGNGQLGVSDLNNRSSPVQIGSGTTWSLISTNNYTSLATKTDGSLWSWGGNNYGTLGFNDRIYRSSPTQVASGTTWSKFSAGQANAVAIKTDGTLWAWGFAAYGQLGNNTGGPARSSPVQIGSGTTWSLISTNNYTSLATKTDGTLWVWGANLGGTLGLGDRVYRSSPTQVGSATNWNQISMGYYNAAAIKTDGTLWVWGINYYGQLGQNNVVYRSSPTQVGTNTNWSKVITGVNTIAITTN